MDGFSAELSGTKHSYTIPCSSAFRDAVERLAQGRGVNVGDMARSVLLVVPVDVIETYDDPGEPPSEDREVVVLKSGPAAGRPWRRKPRLQVRMAPGYRIEVIRRALNIALAMADGSLAVHLHDPKTPPPQPAPAVEPERPAPKPELSETAVQAMLAEDKRLLQAAGEEIERLRATISVLRFDPLSDGVNSRAEALYVLGFPPGTYPDARAVRGRFRMLATIHHPDSNFGDHERMSQLNQAMEILRDGL
jgi:hypothetical protein